MEFAIEKTDEKLKQLKEATRNVSIYVINDDDDDDDDTLNLLKCYKLYDKDRVVVRS